MRTQEQWLADYAVSHQNTTNKRIHTIAVPGIYLSIVGLIWSIPSLSVFDTQLNWVFGCACTRISFLRHAIRRHPVDDGCLQRDFVLALSAVLSNQQFSALRVLSGPIRGAVGISVYWS